MVIFDFKIVVDRHHNRHRHHHRRNHHHHLLHHHLLLRRLHRRPRRRQPTTRSSTARTRSRRTTPFRCTWPRRRSRVRRGARFAPTALPCCTNLPAATSLRGQRATCTTHCAPSSATNTEAPTTSSHRHPTGRSACSTLSRSRSLRAAKCPAVGSLMRRHCGALIAAHSRCASTRRAIVCSSSATATSRVSTRARCWHSTASRFTQSHTPRRTRR